MSQAAHPCGVIFLDKPKGWTSRKAVNHIIHSFAKPEQKNRKQRPKAGHAGTLDPLATGMLPILIGEATRFASMGLNAEKSYMVTLDLSFQTNTLDLEGEVLARYLDISIQQQAVEEVLDTFRGVIQQTPPAFSAIKIDGQRAHTLARQGQDVHMQSREVEIKALHFVALEANLLTLHVDCSKGTYIRSLARDIGLALGCGGCVTMLRRTSSGGWPEQCMVTVEELEEKKETCIVPLQVWLRDLPELVLSDIDAKRFVQGQRLSLQFDLLKAEREKVLCRVTHADVMLGTAIYDVAKHILQPERVMPSAQEKLK
ncbi:tRNA pseudouridine(55) synthase TruB [Ghiorsea bivora]|uniref:tRNA pseudouridine(55) synthase TruB n=1 Tax=Ghiorsea bivora TaxID=1485545 RepID=UPI00056FDD4F|nr:tRNA pseudouridine(55) synthase TruB [Ghiorsea bivora]